ncbi:Hypothetical predicted protein [Drosophila guanche]|uniref:Uncharacterized protein n=1 Tax=Drosophila guanche TaxID=7266 RepID=A0A3B0JP23_DROGU|nr:Hypothetical predicted protein [Drosophila guanche]
MLQLWSGPGAGAGAVTTPSLGYSYRYALSVRPFVGLFLAVCRPTLRLNGPKGCLSWEPSLPPATVSG